MDFLQQSDHLQKNTPGIDNQNDHIQHTDGFGFAYFNSLTHRWKSIKSAKYYKEVKNMDDIVNQISVSDTVIGHIRKQTGEAGVSLLNTHPFTHKNQLFLHNGSLVGYDNLKYKLRKQIAPQYRKFIRGDTDTEWMFYLFLTIKDYLENSVPPKQFYTNSKIEKLFGPCKDLSVELLIFTVCRFFQHLYKQFGQFTANIVYSNKDYTVITRCSNSPNNVVRAPSLYLNGEEKQGKLLISSEPLVDKYKLIPEQTVIFVCNSTGKYAIRDLYHMCDIHI